MRLTRIRQGRRIRCWTVTALAVLCFVVAAMGAVATADDSSESDDSEDLEDEVSTQILVELVQGVDIGTIETRYSVTALEGVEQLSVWLVEVAPGADADLLAETMEEDPDIVNAEAHELAQAPEGTQRSIPDLGLVLPPTDFLEQWGAQTINSSAAHQSHTGSGIVIAVLDSGIDPDRPELLGRLSGGGADFTNGDGTTFPQPDGIDNDLDGLVDEALHHGTFVAGLISLTAPDAAILPIRVLDSEGRGTVRSLTLGVLYAVSRGVDVINISAGLVETSDVLKLAIRTATDRGIVVVAAAGNGGTEDVQFPASDDEVIGVGSIGADLLPSTFTNFGEEVTLSAPGEELLSYPVGVDLARWQGTSFATPLVTGGVALLLERYPGLSLETVHDLLRQTAVALPSPASGERVLDLAALVEVLTEDTTSLKLDRNGTTSVLRFSPVLNAETYDVVRGNVALLDADLEDRTTLGTLTCMINDQPTTQAPGVLDLAVPAPGDTWFYLFRANGAPLGYATPGRTVRLPGAGDCAGN